MSIRLDILTLIRSGVTSRKDILERLDLRVRSFNNCIRFLENKGWVECLRPMSSSTSFSSYTITELGIEKMSKMEVDAQQQSAARKTPDYDLMRSHLKVDVDVNDSQLIALWNDATDYYLPYEDDKDAIGQIHMLGTGDWKPL